MDDFVSFGVFDKEADVDVDRRFLPHWFQPGVATFITFRTADSMPREVVEKWKTEVREWLAKRGVAIGAREKLPSVEQLQMRMDESRKVLGWEDRRGASGHNKTDKVVGEYLNLRNSLWHGFLDECHGACVFRNRELAAIVLDSLRHFDGERYDLDSAIIMPNHVHLIVQFRPPVTCREQCKSWLHYTAFQVNQRIGSKGVFWQSEPFDHLIRSEEQFFYLQSYIAQNGIAANLPESQYLYWSRQ